MSLPSAGLQLSLVGDWKSLKGTKSLLALGESTITVSGSSWGRDCLLEPNRFTEGRRNLKNLPFPKGNNEKIYRQYQFVGIAYNFGTFCNSESNVDFNYFCKDMEQWENA